MATRDYLKEAETERYKERTSRRLGEAVGAAAFMTPAAMVASGGSLLPLVAAGSAGFWAGKRAIKEYGRGGTAARRGMGTLLDPSYDKARGFVDRNVGKVAKATKLSKPVEERVSKILKTPVNAVDWVSKELPAGAIGLANAGTFGVIPLEDKLLRETWKFTGFNAIRDSSHPRYSKAKFVLGTASWFLSAPVALPLANIIGGIDFLNNGVNWLIGEDSAIGKIADKWRTFDTSEAFKGTEFEKVGNTVESFTKGMDNFTRKLSGAPEPKAA